MRGTHERVHSRFPGIVKGADDGGIFFKFHRLRHGFLIRDMVDSEKLVIPE
jgi:hypothetical protein